MTLPAGTRLGPYEIIAPLGAGGMGEVYRATDTRLARDVALKVLPAEFARDEQLRARFEREARAISSLNHPNICMLFDVGQQNDVEYLVMEYLDGEPLTERLARGRMPVMDVLRHGIEIVDALDKAHRTGIIHRDLKPGNVILTRGGGAKLLDFGLAKAMDAALVASTSPQSTTALLPSEPLTAEGTLLGTFCYMAPEQIEYARSDARSDIFAFGCVMYEMLTGRRAFAAASRAGMIAQIIASDPPPIAALRPLTPLALDRLVRTCLAKNPDDRFQTAHDVMLALQWIRDEQSNPSLGFPLVRPRVPRWREGALWSLALITAIASAVGIALWSRHEIAALSSPLTADLVPPRGFRFVFTGDYAGAPVLSHDGRRVAFVAASPEGKRTLWVRSLNSANSREIENSDDATWPFWSPDARSLGFFAHGKLKTVDAGGGVPLVIADAPDARGGSWSDDNVIIYSPETRAGLYRIAANGGPAVALTLPSDGMTTNRWPLFLPGGKSFLYIAANHLQPGSRATLHLHSLDLRSDRVVTQTMANVGFVDGKLLMLHDSNLVSQPFDTARGVLTGTPSIVAHNVRSDASTWHAVFDAAGRTLLYQAGGTLSGTRLAWFSRDGKNLGALGELARYYDLKLSPDGHRLVTNAGDPSADIWVIDVDRDIRTRLTFEALNEAPVWSADGSEIIYAARDARGDHAAVYRRRADGSGQRQLIATLEGDADPGSVSPDGRWVIVSLWRAQSRDTPQIWAVPLVPGQQVRPLIAGQFKAHDPRVSPDGRWLAYTSNESGRDEIYVIPFLVSGGKWQVTTGGGHSSRWTPDGAHLDFLTTDNTLTEVDVQSRGGLVITATRTRFRLDVNPGSSSDYDLAADGRVIANGGEADPSPLALVTNWR